jgi:phosphatidylglycerophosphate synthase
MTSPIADLVIYCPAGPSGGAPDYLGRTLLGLTIGERVLLAASFGGMKRVAFVGPGTPPSCSRASLEIVPLDLISGTGRAVFVTADAVFDRKLLGSPHLAPEGGPLRCLGATELDALQRDPSAVAIGAGRADSGEGFALRVTDDASARRAEWALLQSLRKPIDGVVSRHLNRHVSTFLTRYLVKTGLSPNVFTVIFLGIGLLAGWFALQGGPWWALVLAGFLFQAQSILDGCDGEIARLTYQFSKAGQWLDSIGDDITNYTFCFCLALGQAHVTGSDWLVTAGAVTLAAQVLASGILYRRLIMLGTGDLLAIPDLVTKSPTLPPGGGAASAAGTQSPLLAFIRAISKRDAFVAIIAGLTAIQLPITAFLVYAGGTFPTLFGIVLNDYLISKRDAAARRAA